MKRNYRKPKQIIKLLQLAEKRLAEDRSVEDICREFGVSDSTFYHWRKKYGRMKPEEVSRLEQLQQENHRLKKLVADQVLDIDILKEALSGNY